MAGGQGVNEPGNEVQKWADDAMFRSESHDASTGPRVHLLHMTADPLAAIAACAKMYKGEVVRSFADVTHAERREYLAEMQKTKLKMPLEAVQLHFMLENVSRAFTHQLVRQRTAAYAQESMRFAVVEDMTEAVSLPPSLAGTQPLGDWLLANGWTEQYHPAARVEDFVERHASREQRWRFKWDSAVGTISDVYNYLVNDGMPAEDARGLMPTNIVTRVNYITNLRGLLDHAGNRLCTQAQFEWRLVFSQIAHAIRTYGQHNARLEGWRRTEGNDDYLAAGLGWLDSGDTWQYEAIADLLQPVCYQTGRCAFEASFDRKCSIRDRVQMNAAHGCPSSEWGEDHAASAPREPRTDAEALLIPGISPREWLADPTAAR